MQSRWTLWTCAHAVFAAVDRCVTAWRQRVSTPWRHVRVAATQDVAPWPYAALRCRRTDVPVTSWFDQYIRHI